MRISACFLWPFFAGKGYRVEERESVLSVGIDVGTTTTQVVFSRLHMKNSAGLYSVPKITIADKEVLYRSEPYFTPLKDRFHIDAAATRELVLKEYRSAGFRPEDISTGAVIITGESARKENAEAIVNELSGIAGEFVVSAAGPDMESVIAGKGSGAFDASKEQHCSVLNLDIGGGTTNAVLFSRGRTVATGCVDIGGRIVRTDPDGTVTGISPSAERIAAKTGIPLSIGMKNPDALRRLCTEMARLLAEMAGLCPRSSLYSSVVTIGSADLRIERPADRICYSGGVADAVSGRLRNAEDPFRFGDIGILLGRAVAEDPDLSRVPKVSGGATISATVIGAGSYTTTVSGSTIAAEGRLLPMKNLLVYRCTEQEQEELFRGNSRAFSASLSSFLEKNPARAAVALRGLEDPTYAEVRSLASALSESADACLNPEQPLVVVFETDMAKVFGLCFHAVSRRDLIAIDSIPVQSTDHLDIGKPIVGGLVAPVVVKTLLFGH